MSMNTIQFYTKYDELATKREALDATKNSLPDKEVRIREFELAKETTEFFADFVGSQIDFSA
jgi:hypothetical protein